MTYVKTVKVNELTQQIKALALKHNDQDPQNPMVER